LIDMNGSLGPHIDRLSGPTLSGRCLSTRLHRRGGPSGGGGSTRVIDQFCVAICRLRANRNKRASAHLRRLQFVLAGQDGTLNFVVVIVSGDGLKEVMLEPPRVGGQGLAAHRSR